MPKTAELIDKRRRQWGAEHVNGCIADGLASKPNRFYAFENGFIVGTAFTQSASPITDECLLRIAMLGNSFYMVMEQPKGWVDNGEN